MKRALLSVCVIVILLSVETASPSIDNAVPFHVVVVEATSGHLEIAAVYNQVGWKH